MTDVGESTDIREGRFAADEAAYRRVNERAQD
jgi:hypothetical protein